MEAKGPGQLPRNERQVTNIRKKERLKEYHQSDCAGSTSADDLFVVMEKAHTEDPSNQFIRAIRAAPDPAIVLANDYQIHDMVTFSTSSSEFCVLTIDPTFSLGEFHVQAVTPITYRHLLLETKRTGTNPVFLGPTLIHYRKTFAVYLFFASTLIGLSPKLQGVKAFGTDGEQALANAFNHEIPFSQQLICSVHVHQNIKQKCNELQIPSDLSQKILNDIFGIKIGDVFGEGIVRRCYG